MEDEQKVMVVETEVRAGCAQRLQVVAWRASGTQTPGPPGFWGVCDGVSGRDSHSDQRTVKQTVLLGDGGPRPMSGRPERAEGGVRENARPARLR